MNIVRDLQELDGLIVEYTKPPITPMLRNKLSIALEQAQAHSEAVAKQERTLATQAQTIERMMIEKQSVDAKCLALQAEITRRDSDDAKGFAGQQVC